MVCVPVCVNKKQLKGMMEDLIDKNKTLDIRNRRTSMKKTIKHPCDGKLHWKTWKVY